MKLFCYSWRMVCKEFQTLQVGSILIAIDGSAEIIQNGRHLGNQFLFYLIRESLVASPQVSRLTIQDATIVHKFSPEKAHGKL